VKNHKITNKTDKTNKNKNKDQTEKKKSSGSEDYFCTEIRTSHATFTAS